MNSVENPEYRFLDQSVTVIIIILVVVVSLAFGVLFSLSLIGFNMFAGCIFLLDCRGEISCHHLGESKRK